MFNNKKNEKRSPLKARPLRVPGQSLDEESNRILYEELLPWMALGAFSLVFAGLEWYRWLTSSPPQPLVMTALVLALLVYMVLRVRKGLRQVRGLRLGRDGERAVGQYLDELRERGYRILHDIVGEGFNIDHVVFSPHGIFVIETKTLSKPIDRGAAVRFEDGLVHKSGVGHHAFRRG